VDASTQKTPIYTTNREYASITRAEDRGSMQWFLEKSEFSKKLEGKIVHKVETTDELKKIKSELSSIVDRPTSIAEKWPCKSNVITGQRSQFDFGEYSCHILNSF